MSWPLSQDYNEAVQYPAVSFSDPELKAGKPTTNTLGLPMPRSGNFADVYEIRCPATSSKWAVKCFTRQVPGLRERYSEISRALQDAKLPFTVDFQFQEQGIRIHGDWFPILKMRWVEGLLLNEFVRDNIDKPALLGQLSIIWSRMAKRLREAGMAHCDLQHGNVILVQNTQSKSLAVKLIDYDGMFVPALAGKKSGEVGHPNYQHPQRLRKGTFSVEVDRFPLLVVATALQALSVGGRYFSHRYDNGDNMLFKEADLRAPAQSALFRELLNLADAQSKALTLALVRACHDRLEEAPRIEDLVGEPRPPVQPPAAVPVRPAAVTVIAPAGITPAPTNPWDFNESGFEEIPPEPPEPGPRRAIPKWVWLVGSALAVAVTLAAVAVFAIQGGSKPNAPEGPAVAVENPTKKEKPKERGTNPPKDTGKEAPKQPPKEPAERAVPMPRLIVSPSLALPPSGSAYLLVRADRHGFDGPISIQVENLPAGVTCRREVVIPVGESLIRLEFQTGSNAAEGSPKVDLLALADARIVDRKILFLLVPKQAPLPRTAHDDGTEKKSLVEIREFVGHKRSVFGVAISPDSKLILSAEPRRDSRVWNSATGEQLRLLEGGSWGAAFSPNGKLAATCGRDAYKPGQPYDVVRIWDTKTWMRLKTLVIDKGEPMCVAFSPDGRRVMAGTSIASGTVGGKAIVWDVETGKEIRRFAGFAGSVQTVAFSPDGKLALSGGGNGRAKDFDIRLWDTESGREVRRFVGHTSGVGSVAFSHDGRYFISAGSDKTIRLWEVETGRQSKVFTGHEAQVSSVAIAPNDLWFISGSGDGTVRVWETATGNEIQLLSGHSGNVTAIALSHDGTLAVSSSLDKTVVLWGPPSSGGNHAPRYTAPPLPAKDFVNTLEMTMVYIKPGTFLIGSPETEIQRNKGETQHRVTLAKGFCIGATLVTQKQWMSVMTDNPSRFMGDDLPVDSVAWGDCKRFCRKLSEKEGRKYRLPTEAEWEYACRAGTTTPYWSGETITTGQANFNDDERIKMIDIMAGKTDKKTTPVMKFKPNPWGLYDMHGNLWQWCEDFPVDYDKADTIDPLGSRKVGTARILRGGSWMDLARAAAALLRESPGMAVAPHLVFA